MTTSHHLCSSLSGLPQLNSQRLSWTQESWLGTSASMCSRKMDNKMPFYPKHSFHAACGAGVYERRKVERQNKCVILFFKSFPFWFINHWGHWPCLNVMAIPEFNDLMKGLSSWKGTFWGFLALLDPFWGYVAAFSTEACIRTLIKNKSRFLALYSPWLYVE